MEFGSRDGVHAEDAGPVGGGRGVMMTASGDLGKGLGEGPNIRTGALLADRLGTCSPGTSSV